VGAGVSQIPERAFLRRLETGLMRMLNLASCLDTRMVTDSADIAFKFVGKDLGYLFLKEGKLQAPDCRNDVLNLDYLRGCYG
jgi:hypothetical protein